MYLFALGDVVGFPVNFGQRGNIAILALGAVIFIFAIAILVLYGLHRNVEGGSPIGISLICVGLLFAALITEGRFIFGYVGASASRYTTMDLLVPIGIYLTVIARTRRTLQVPPSMQQLSPVPATMLPLPPARASSPTSTTPNFSALWDRLRVLPETLSAWADRYVLSIAQVVILAIIVLQVAIGLPNGLHGARSNYVYQATGAHVLLTINHQSDERVREYLYVFESAAFIRRQAATLEHYHLSLFAPGASSSPRTVGNR